MPSCPYSLSWVLGVLCFTLTPVMLPLAATLGIKPSEWLWTLEETLPWVSDRNTQWCMLICKIPFLLSVYNSIDRSQQNCPQNKLQWLGSWYLCSGPNWPGYAVWLDGQNSFLVWGFTALYLHNVVMEVYREFFEFLDLVHALTCCIDCETIHTQVYAAKCENVKGAEYYLKPLFVIV